MNLYTHCESDLDDLFKDLDLSCIEYFEGLWDMDLGSPSRNSGVRSVPKGYGLGFPSGFSGSVRKPTSANQIDSGGVAVIEATSPPRFALWALCRASTPLKSLIRDYSNIFSGWMGLSLQAGEEDDLETPDNTNAAKDENEDGLISQSELPDDHDDIEDPTQNYLESSEIETDSSGKTTSRQRTFSKLLKKIMNAPGILVHNALNKYAEEVINKVKDKGFRITSFACAQLLLLYKRIDKRKIADVLLVMEKENAKLSLFCYRILRDIEGQSSDLIGMDQIVETTKSEAIELVVITQVILARPYISGGLKEKAEAIMKEMEGENLNEHCWTCRLFFLLYAELGTIDQVKRIWTVCESNPPLDVCLASTKAWGKLKRIEKANAVFNRRSKTWKKLSSKYYTTLLNVYADHKMVAKGKDLVKQMAKSGIMADERQQWKIAKLCTSNFQNSDLGTSPVFWREALLGTWKLQ